MLLDAAGGVPEIRQSRCRLLNYILLHFNPVLKNQGKQMNAFTRAWYALERHYQDTRHVLCATALPANPTVLSVCTSVWTGCCSITAKTV